MLETKWKLAIGLIGGGVLGLIGVGVASQTVRGGTLIFQTGFEPATGIVGDRFTGADNSRTNSDWNASIASFADPNRVVLNYTGGTIADRYVALGPDPLNANNRVLKFWLARPWVAEDQSVKARIQLDLYGIGPGLREFRQSVRMFVHPDFKELEQYPKKISWLTISEFWNNEWWVPNELHGFRISVGMGKPSSAPAPLTFMVEAQDSSPTPNVYAPITLWHEGGKVPVPIGQWFTVDYSIKEGLAGVGRFRMTIRTDGGQTVTVCDVAGPTHNTRDLNPNGFTGFNPMKLYTSKEVAEFMSAKNKPLQIYWDDLKLWKVQ